MGTIAQFFGSLLRILYEFFGSYGWALIAFTFIVNIILLPLTYKQQKSTAGLQKIQPQLAEIQKKYKDNKEKLGQEQMKLYQDNGINPIGGCLPLLIQLPIIFVLFMVIREPLKYMFGLSVEQISALSDLIGNIDVRAGFEQIEIARNLTVQIIEKAGLTGILPIIDFNFLGLDLAATPSWSTFNLLWVIPILSALTSWLLNKIMQAQTPQPTAGADGGSAAQSMQTMNKIMPLMSAYFTFLFPAGMGLYWIIGNVARIAAQYGISWFLKKNKDPLVIDTKTGK